MFKIAEELSELPAYEDEEYDKPESFLKVLFYFFLQHIFHPFYC